MDACPHSVISVGAMPGKADPVLNAQTLRCQSRMGSKKVFAVCAAKDGRISCLKGKPWMVSSMDMPVFAAEEVQQNMFALFTCDHPHSANVHHLTCVKWFTTAATSATVLHPASVPHNSSFFRTCLGHSTPYNIVACVADLHIQSVGNRQ